MTTVFTLVTLISVPLTQNASARPKVQVTFNLAEREYAKNYRGQAGKELAARTTMELTPILSKEFGFIEFSTGPAQNTLTITIDAATGGGSLPETRYYLELTGPAVNAGSSKFNFLFRVDDDYTLDVTDEKNFRGEIVLKARAYFENNPDTLVREFFSAIAIAKGGHHVTGSFVAALPFGCQEHGIDEEESEFKIRARLLATIPRFRLYKALAAGLAPAVPQIPVNFRDRILVDIIGSINRSTIDDLKKIAIELHEIYVLKYIRAEGLASPDELEFGPR